MDDEFVTMTEAREILGVSAPKIWRMVRDGELIAYQSAVDRRRKMIRRADIEATKKLRPIDKRRTATRTNPSDGENP